MNQQREKFTRALVLPALKSINRPVTLLTQTVHKVNEQLVINKYGYCTQIKLVKLLECTGVYCQFEFAIMKVLGFEDQYANETKSPADHDSAWTLL